VFVTFEGIDGSGKSTQARLLAEALRNEGHDVVATREPGGTALGEDVRVLVLGDGAVSPWAEAALFAAARAQLVAEVVQPALVRGAVVVCDRFLDSSLAYQGIARGLGVDEVLALNLPGLQGVMPDRTFLLDVSVGAALERGGEQPDRIEREGRAFLEQVGRAYHEVARLFPERILVVDGGPDADAISRRIRGDLRAVLP
jgi:dTMP kinase